MTMMTMTMMRYICYKGRVLTCRGCSQITRKAYSDKTSVDFVAYRGQSVVYAVVMRLLTDGDGKLPHVAAYIPVVTYSCNYTDDQCAKQGEFDIESDTSALAIAVITYHQSSLVSVTSCVSSGTLNSAHSLCHWSLPLLSLCNKWH